MDFYLEKINIDGYTYLGYLEDKESDDRIHKHWYWKETNNNSRRHIYLSIIFDKNEIDAQIDCNYGFIGSYIPDFETTNNTEGVKQLKEYIEHNLYNIGIIENGLTNVCNTRYLQCIFIDMYKRLKLPGKYYEL